MPSRVKPKKLNAEQLWEYALASLGRRAQSTAELRRRLAARAEHPEDITSVMQKLTEYQLADDKKFSEAFASSRLQNQGLGKFRVLRDLRAKQVPDRIAAAVVDHTYAETSEAELINSYLARKYRNKDLREFLSEPKNLAAAYRRLRLAGFGSGPAIDALKRHASLPEDWNEPDEAEE